MAVPVALLEQQAQLDLLDPQAIMEQQAQLGQLERGQLDCKDQTGQLAQLAQLAQ